MRTARITLLLLTALIAASPAVADDGDCRLIRGADTTEDTTDDVEVCRQDVWFHQAATKLGNLSATEVDTAPSWDTEAPTASSQEGGGAAYVASRPGNSSSLGNEYRATFTGTFTGTIDNAAFTFYASNAYYFLGQAWDVQLHLLIDGEIVAQRAEAGTELPWQAVTDQYGKVSVAVTNLYEMMTLLGMDTDPETEHTVTLKITTHFWGDGNAVFLYDATDFPSGAIFNLETDKLGPYVKVDALQ